MTSELSPTTVSYEKWEHSQFQYQFPQDLILRRARLQQAGKGYQLQTCLASNHSDLILKIYIRESNLYI